MQRSDLDRADRQRLLRMLAASLVLHAFAFAWLKALPRVAALPSPMALIASLRPAMIGNKEQVRQPAATAAKAAVRPEARRTMTRRDARAQPVVSEAAGPTPRPFPSPVATRAEAPAPTMAVANAPAAPPAPPPAVAAPVAPDTRPTAADAEQLLAGYGRRLSELFSRRQQYPRLAALRGWEGEVRVRLSVARQGRLNAVRLERSSGFDVLDRHALAMIGEIVASADGGRLPAPPAAFDGDVEVVVPVSYRLRRPA